MAAIYQTAYPRIKSDITPNELGDVYTPTAEDLEFALRHCKRTSASFLGLLIQLKTTQRLGRFVPLGEIPKVIIAHIKNQCRSRVTLNDLQTYYTSGSKDRHVKLVRRHLNIKAYDTIKTSELAQVWAQDAATTKEALPDIINVTLEYLVKERYELPAYSVLERICQAARAEVNTRYYDQLCGFLTDESRQRINDILRVSTGLSGFGWSTLKSEPKRLTPRNIHAYIQYLEWLTSLQTLLPTDLGLPPVKHQQFIDEAKALDYAELVKLKLNKRLALVIVLIRHQYARTLDNAADIFMKLLLKMDRSAQKLLEKYLSDHQKQTDHLISVLSGTVRVYLDKPESVTAFDPVLGKNSDQLLHMCEQYMAFAGNNYLPFMVQLYKKQRSTLFRTIEILNLASATEDKDLLNAFQFILKHKQRRTEFLSIQNDPNDSSAGTIINIRWVRENWWKLVTGKSTKSAHVTEVNKMCFELCVFERIAEELSTGDLFIPYSETFDDYREQMITWEEYEAQLPAYCEEVGLVDGDVEFARTLKDAMEASCHKADSQFPEDELVRIENGNLVIGKRKPDQPSPEIEEIGALLRDRLEKINVLDVIINVEKWLNLNKQFGPLSGFESRISDPVLRFVLTVFCYGTNIGPTETVRSVQGVSRKQVAWLNLKRTTEARLDKAIAKINNAYKKYRLIECWGSGNSVSADGKLWDLYEDNLLSEYHIRYGSYGGIAYYHVSDTYIALFSRFIPCGVYEAIYILDGLLNDESDFNPDTVHGDTQAQSTPVFGLALLLGIKLMPRIRNIKDLNFYKSDRTMVLKHIQSLFKEPIKWELIEKHYADMMRTAMSVKAGKITASTILRRFGTKNRKNKLYFAFRELGRVVRTMFLLEYITDVDLRKTIQAATCKSEEFNEFARWLFFANGGKIPANLKHEQSKIVKYNHLLANFAILYNVNAMTEVFNQLKSEGHNITREHMAAFSPYHTEHLGRLGSFEVDLTKQVRPMTFELLVD
ncbi:Tn3 family transposase [Cellvibrio sp. QJXJ]|uniref:Tn3 family transposase n=1 Tax=Cellvibrio sp. QJXJ TaxID=2964606 RepID=UPI0021C28519|nr:Tn3 family transposase [Cellvibrio sp. QJXJ]UUA73609.1 Tn3 family transposase [Cellvibrio sp. QJXJ]